MYDSAAVVHAHEIGGDDMGIVTFGIQKFHGDITRGTFAASKFADRRTVRHGIIQRLVGYPHQPGAIDGVQYLIFRLNRGQTVGGDYHAVWGSSVGGNLNDGVFGLGANGEGGISGKRPGRGGPGQQVGGYDGGRTVQPPGSFEFDENRRVGGVFAVTQRDFVG